MSLPNCLRRVSECIFLLALSSMPANTPLSAAPGLGDESIADVLLSVRLSMGDRGISCSCGWGWKPVMQSMTSTLAALWGDEAAGVRLGRWVADE
jgi:hypothetical protein